MHTVCNANGKGLCSECIQHALGKDSGLAAIGDAGDHQKLLAAPAHQQIGVADCGTDAPRSLDEHAVARIVAVMVVHFFEVVQIDERRRSDRVR